MTLDDFARVADVALQSIHQLLAEWFPQGVVDGHEFCIGSASGEAGKSMRIRLTGKKAGIWSDFSSEEAGRDLISLYANIQGITNGQACARLAEQLGVALTDDDSFKNRSRKPSSAPPKSVKPAPAQAGQGVEAQKVAAPRTEWVPILPVPGDSGPYPAAHLKRGRPEKSWEYRDQAGQLLGVIYRFRTSDGGKEILPCVYAEHPVSKKREWRWMQWIDPRPLYLANPQRDGFTVLVVEGEKCADAAYAMLGDSVDVVSWPGGGKAVQKADWSSLAGRDVLLWADADAKRYKPNHALAGQIMPEADQPGMKAMLTLREILRKQRCRCQLVDIPAPDQPHHIWEVDETEHDGWDIATLIETGATYEEVAQWLARVRVDPDEEEEEDAPTDEQVPAGDEVPSWVLGNEEAHASNVVALRPDMPGDLAAKSISTASKASASKVSRGAIRAAMISTGQGGVKGCRENVYVALKQDPGLIGLVALDQFAMLQVKRRNPPWPSDPGEWNEGDDFHLGIYLANHYGLVIASVGDIERAVAQAARENGFNPVIDMFEECATVWDGTPRVESAFAQYWGAPPSEYLSTISRMFFVGLAKRAYVPGVKHDNAPVFEGMQGEGKSTALSILGAPWFADTPFRMGDKDGFLSIQGILIYEVAELEQFNRSEVTAVKAFMSSQMDRYREPYGRRMKNQPRRTVFAATTNEGQYFKDMTGNRRFWPVETGLLDLDGLTRDRAQLLGEAVHMMRAGVKWYPTREEQARLISPQQESRELWDEWTGRIWEYLEGLDSEGKPVSVDPLPRVTARELLTRALHFEIGKIGQAKTESMRISSIMRKLGWKKERETKGAREWFYSRPVPDETPPEHTHAQAVQGEADESIPF